MYLGNLYMKPSTLSQSDCPLDLCNHLFCMKEFCWTDFTCPPNDACVQHTCDGFTCTMH